jgi:aldehyde:ferredoxin oxidoreductase
MTGNPLGSGGYMNKVLRVDLTNEQITEEFLSPDILRLYVGGVGLAAKYLYDEVMPGTKWDDPENRIIISIGPVNGCRVAGSGAFNVTTKGTLTGGSTASQANGYFGAYLKFSGYDAIVILGKAKRWLYLYVHDGIAELKDARHLIGKDTWDTEEQVKVELGKGKHEASVFCIGPAGENLVRFAAIVGDRGHVAGHNGTGAVMGSKKLKAIVAARGLGTIAVNDSERLQILTKTMMESFKTSLPYEWGTSMFYASNVTTGLLPVRNLTTNLFPEAERFRGDNYRNRFEQVERHSCWSCTAHHCSILKVKEGRFAGFIGEEPEYEGWAAWSSLIGCTDVEAAFVLCNLCDRLGFEINEAGWVIAFAIECFEKGLISVKETGGLMLTWDNPDVVMKVLKMIASRDGLGDILAEGTMRASQKLGKETYGLGVYLKKGVSPRGHDHRARWVEMLDTATSNTGTIETGPVGVKDSFSPEQVSAGVTGQKGLRTFVDCLVMCMIPTNTMAFTKVDHLVNILNAVTGWNFTPEEAQKTGLRAVNLMRAFNIRHGLNPDVEFPSIRYSSAPVDGPIKGISVAPHWGQMLDDFYRSMGWDRVSGRPLPETLKGLGLDFVISDIWK